MDGRSSFPLEDRTSRLLPVLVSTAAHSRYMVATMIPTRTTEDLLLGMWELIQRLARVPRRLIWDNEGGIGRRGQPAAGVATFMGTLATRLVLVPQAIPSPKASLNDATAGSRRELSRLRRYPLILVDEVGYLTFEQEAVNLFFQLVSSRHEHASIILTSNLAFSGWVSAFGDQIVAPAMIDRIVHHADVLTLKGASYRLRGRGEDTLPSAALDKESRS